MLFPPINGWGQNGDLLYWIKEAWTTVDIPKHLTNSLIIALATMVLSVIIATPAAFGFVRFKFPLKKWLPLSYLIFMMMPDLVYANSLFTMYHKWGLLDTYIGLILIHTMRAIPFVMFIMIGIFESIPETLEEAAYTLGCSRFQTLIKVTAPMALPGLAAASIFAFLRSWDEFVLTAYLGGSRTNTIVVAASNLLMGHDVHPWRASTVSLIMLIPVMVFIFFIQKYMKAGYISGGMARTY